MAQPAPDVWCSETADLPNTCEQALSECLDEQRREAKLQIPCRCGRQRHIGWQQGVVA